MNPLRWKITLSTTTNDVPEHANCKCCQGGFVDPDQIVTTGGDNGAELVVPTPVASVPQAFQDAFKDQELIP